VKVDPLEVVDDHIPDFSDIVAASNAGLAHIARGDGVTFPVNSTADEVIEILGDCLPKVFAWLSDLGCTEFVDNDGDTVSTTGWVLMMPKRQRLKVVQLLELTGRDLQNLVSNTKNRVNHLTLCM
jgi:hypothetical protein